MSYICRKRQRCWNINFFNKVINGLLAVDVKIDEKDKALILLSSLPQSYDHIITIILYSKETLILEEVTSISYQMRSRKGQIKRSRKDQVWWSREGKKAEKEEKVQARQRHVLQGRSLKELLEASTIVIERERASCGGRSSRWCWHRSINGFLCWR